MQLVGDVESSEDGNLARIHRQRSGRNLAHALIDILRQLPQILRIAVRADGVGLVVDFHLNGLRGRIAVFAAAKCVGAHPRIASARSGSAAATTSSMASTFALIASRSASKRSI